MQVTVFEMTDAGAVLVAEHEAPAEVESMQMNSTSLLLLTAGGLDIIDGDACLYIVHSSNLR